VHPVEAAWLNVFWIAVALSVTPSPTAPFEVMEHVFDGMVIGGAELQLPPELLLELPEELLLDPLLELELLLEELPIMASQPAVVPPPVPAQVQSQAMPLLVTDEGVPALQRLAAVVGALVKVWFSAVPHAPLTTPPPELLLLDELELEPELPLTTPLLEPELEPPLEPVTTPELDPEVEPLLEPVVTPELEEDAAPELLDELLLEPVVTPELELDELEPPPS
jgi:hypothetical protein